MIDILLELEPEDRPCAPHCLHTYTSLLPPTPCPAYAHLLTTIPVLHCHGQPQAGMLHTHSNAMCARKPPAFDDEQLLCWHQSESSMIDILLELEPEDRPCAPHCLHAYTSLLPPTPCPAYAHLLTTIPVLSCHGQPQAGLLHTHSNAMCARKPPAVRWWTTSMLAPVWIFHDW